MVSTTTPVDGLNAWVATGLFGLYAGALTAFGVVQLQRSSL
jgi:hypothetical protein